MPTNKPQWIFLPRLDSGTIRFDHGEVLLQGDEASELENQMQRANSEAQASDILNEYSEIAQ